MMTCTFLPHVYDVTLTCRITDGVLLDPGDAVHAYLMSHDLLWSFDLRDLFGGFPVHDPTTSVVGRMPIVRHDTYVQGWDAFGNLVSTIGHMLSDWDFSTQLTPSTEKPVSHHNVSGILQPLDVDAVLIPHDGQGFIGLNIVKEGGTVVYVEKAYWTTTLPSFVPGEFPQGMSTNTYNGITYEYSQFASDKSRLQYATTLTWVDGLWTYRQFIAYRFSYEASVAADLPSGSYALTEVIGGMPICERWFIGSQGWTAGHEPAPMEFELFPLEGPFGATSGSGSSSVCNWIGCVAKLSESDEALLDLVAGRYDSTRSFDAFCGHTSLLLRDCYATAFLSSNDALDSAISRFSSNHIEFFWELHDILAPLDLVRGVQAVIAIRRHPGRALLALLELLANAKLCYSFGIAPLFSDALDVAKKVRPMVSKLSSSDLYGWKTIRGKFDLDIPLDRCGPFEGLHLSTRSKIRIRLNEDSLLPSLLPLRAANLLPSVSTLWDLVPYSFLIDCVIPVGEIADQLETSALMWMAETSYSTHSLKIEYELEDDLLSLHLLSNTVDGSKGTYRLYDRFTLSHLPTAAPTSLPIYGEMGVPDWGILSSLVYLRIPHR